MQLSKYIRCTANGKWKFRRVIPKGFREIFHRRELKFTLRATDIYEVVHEAMTISQNFDKLLHNVVMGNDDKKDYLRFTHLVTVGGYSKNKDGTVSISDLSFDAKDPKDREEVASLLNILREPAQKSEYSTPQVNQFKLSQALELNRKSRKLNPSTLNKVNRVYQLAFDIIGDIDLNGDGAKGLMTLFLNEAIKEPARRSQIKELKGLSYAQQIKYADKHHLPRVSPATTTNLVNLLSSSIEAVKDLDGRLKQNPLSYKQTTKVVGKPEGKNKHLDDAVGFTAEELKVLFSATNLAKIKAPDLLIGYLIGLHTGMRVNEVASLHIEHITKKHGVYCFDLTSWDVGISTANEGRACLKTVASKRLVPISKGLLDAGFLNYVALVKESGSTLLLPTMSWNRVGGYGRNLSRSFMSYCKMLGISPDKGFHELRGTLNNTLKQSGITLEFREDLLGHSNRSMNSRSYTNPVDLDLLQKIVDGITNTEIIVEHYFSKEDIKKWLSSVQKKKSRPKINYLKK